MARDLKKEYEWEKTKYKRLNIKLDKDVAERFLSKLDIPFSVWVKQEIEKYLNEHE